MVVDKLTDVLTAVADPTRREILEHLTEGSATVGELVEPFPITQQAVSKHVARLEEAGLIEKRRVGRRHVCSLNAEPLRLVDTWVGRYRSLWERRLDRLVEHVRHLEREKESYDPEEG